MQDKDGYRLSGRFSFASGCDNANWGILGGMLPLKDGPKPGFFLVPRSQFTIHDDWFTMGLAGTGSKTIVVDDQFVPDYRAVSFNEMLTGNGPGTQTNTNPLYRQPMLAVVPHCLVAPALGMARGALEVFTEQAAGRTTRGAVAGGNNKMSEFTTIQMRVAEATASIDAAQLMIYRDISDTLATVTAGKPADVALRMRNRLTHSFATKLLVQAVDAVFLAAGGSALGLEHPVQRFWRDIHALSSHISLNWDSVSAMYGQHVFGLEPKGQLTRRAFRRSNRSRPTVQPHGVKISCQGTPALATTELWLAREWRQARLLGRPGRSGKRCPCVLPFQCLDRAGGSRSVCSGQSRADPATCAASPRPGPAVVGRRLPAGMLE